jgi:hypothetical protein
MRTCSQKNTGEHLGPTEVSLHTRAVCLRHLRLGLFLTGSGCRRHVRVTPVSDRPADIAGGPVPATNGSRVLFDLLVGLSEQRGRHGEAVRIRGRGALNRGAR